MKKSVIFMCIGGMLALCTPLAASDAVIEPPIVKHVAVEKNKTVAVDPAEESDLTKTSETKTTENADPAPAHTGGVVVISGAALLLIIILLILLF